MIILWNSFRLNCIKNTAVWPVFTTWLTWILISCTSVIITIRDKVEFVITFKTLFEFIFLIDQYWERVIFISKGYPGLKIFVNIHENFIKMNVSKEILIVPNKLHFGKIFHICNTYSIERSFLYDLRDPDDRLVYFWLNWTWTETKISFCSFEWLNHFIFMAALRPRSER